MATADKTLDVVPSKRVTSKVGAPLMFNVNVTVSPGHKEVSPSNSAFGMGKTVTVAWPLTVPGQSEFWTETSEKVWFCKMLLVETGKLVCGAWMAGCAVLFKA